MGMPSDPIAPLRVAVLSATLTFEPKPVDPFEMLVPAVRRTMPRIAPPLDLDAAIYRYRIDAGGRASVLRDAIGARECRIGHRRRRI
jgi:hypothetical protein